MSALIIRAPGKINLILEIIGKRKDGYHLLNSLMQTIDLYDEIQIEKSCKKINLINVTYSQKLQPFVDDEFNAPQKFENNICGKVALKIIEKFNISDKICINLKKNIPIGAGLGGGSSDGAAVALGLNEYFGLNLNQKELIELTAPIGADIPFNIIKGTGIVKGIGDIIEKVNFSEIKRLYFLLIYPSIKCSTIKIYKNFKYFLTKKKDNITIFLDRLKKKESIINLEKCLVNDLEESAFELVPELFYIKQKIEKETLKPVFMSGSGSTLFLIFDNELDLDKKSKKLKTIFKDCFIIKAKPLFSI